MDPLTASTDDKLDTLPPFTDMISELEPALALVVHPLFEALPVPRALSAHPLGRVGEVGWVLEDEMLAAASQFETTEAFDSAAEHVPPAPTGVGPKKVIKMVDFAGHAVICHLGQEKYSIVLFIYDRGVIKYDPLLARDRFSLQIAADAAHQRRLCAYTTYILENGYPTDLESFGQLHDVGEAAVSAELRAEIEKLRARVRERDSTVQGLRALSAADRGSNIGLDSQRATQIANETHAARDIAIGKKTLRGHDDPVRVQQFEQFLAEQVDLDARRHPCPHHQNRPDGMTLEEWRVWSCKLDPGQELFSARRVYKEKKKGMADYIRCFTA